MAEPAEVEALVDLVRDGLVQAVLWALPLFGAAAAASVVAGWIAGRLGLQDASLSLMVRALAVVLALALVGPALGERAQALGSEALARLPAIGQGTAAPGQAEP